MHMINGTWKITLFYFISDMIDAKSYFYVLVMIFASILQVFVIRKLFEDPKR